ncbi:MAG: hypothetical protein H6920_07735 [Sphingomonadaceae bacterium]|nr:hypothetical protein [Sphingomonadaceae bacterium]MCP5383489.1 hypothetical protein [Altererythrobacter sp.]MCP5391494.1 hypothetical protein [Sphingomonadaceae bacterium]MCP5394431.1 hypothetical protein [Sphingomonadaceae bacterium]
MNAAANVPTDDLLAKVIATYGVQAADESAQRQFIAKHIAELETSDNEAVARTGFILKRANEGFGLGHKVPLSIIAMGQAMLGIDLAVAAPFLASNPAAFTAAALGAIYYGYQALEDEERAELHARIGAALDFGVELVKTIVRFCIDTMKSLLDPETLAQIKNYVADAAEAAGNSLYDVTGKLLDRISGLASDASEVASSAGTALGAAAGEAYQKGRALFDRNSKE